MTVGGRATYLSQPAIPLLDFLEQFCDGEARSPWLYGSPDWEFIVECARFQAALIQDTPRSLETSPKGLLLIPLTLRCLVLTQELFLVHASMKRPLYSPNGLCYWLTKRHHDEDPIVEVSESPEASDLSSDIPNQRYGQNISSVLEDLLHLVQSVMMRRNPRDWPALLLTLSLLRTVVEFWAFPTFFMESLGPSHEALEEVFGRLCDLFEITSKGFLPLHKLWTKEAYSKLVDNDGCLVEAFQWMHDIWLDGKFSSYQVTYSR